MLVTSAPQQLGGARRCSCAVGVCYFPRAAGHAVGSPARRWAARRIVCWPAGGSLDLLAEVLLVGRVEAADGLVHLHVVLPAQGEDLARRGVLEHVLRAEAVHG